MKTTRDMTRGNLWVGILLFSLPLIVSNLLQVLFNMADIVVVGQFCGSAALGSVGSTATMVALLTGILIGFGSGINAITAKAIGARDREGVGRCVHTGFLLALLIGLSVFLLSFFGARPLLLLLGTKPELLDDALLYMRVYSCGMPALALYNWGQAVLSAAGDTRRPLYFLTLAGIINVSLNILFVTSLGMGVFGVALASILSQYLSAVLTVFAICLSRQDYRLRLSRLRLSGGEARVTLALGLSAGMQNAICQFANLFVMAGVNTFPTLIVKGNSAAQSADALVYDVMAAFYTACTSFMGQNYGAGDIPRVRKSYFISLTYSFGAGALLGGGLVLFGRQFLSLFTPEADVVEAGMMRLTVLGLSYAVSAFMDCTLAASRGLGKSLIPTLYMLLGSCAFRLIWIYTVFAAFRTVPSLYLLYVFSWAITAVFEILYFARIWKKAKQITKPSKISAPV